MISNAVKGAMIESSLARDGFLAPTQLILILQAASWLGAGDSHVDGRHHGRKAPFASKSGSPLFRDSLCPSSHRPEHQWSGLGPHQLHPGPPGSREHANVNTVST